MKQPSGLSSKNNIVSTKVIIPTSIYSVNDFNAKTKVGISCQKTTL